MGADGGDLSSPGSSVVARIDFLGRRDFKSSLMVETIERELRESAPDEELGEGWAYAD